MMIKASVSILMVEAMLSGCGSSSSSTDPHSSAPYTIGGTIAGLTANGLTLTNGTSSTLWTWVGGSMFGGASAVYGTQGVAAASNVPGARSGAASWADKSGNLWLFGGAASGTAGSTGFLNDLWKFNISSGLWTWVSGSETLNAPGVYGTQGVAAPGTVPAARPPSAFWADDAGNMWLFGGMSLTTDPACGCNESLNDLWEFSPITGLWTWVSGSSMPGAPGVYGTQGVAGASNVPGARVYASFSTDSSGNLWLFGGGYEAIADLNDLWEFSPITGLWTWVSGSQGPSSQGPYGVYGTQGVAAASNAPGARGRAALWTDSGNLFLFGGLGWGQQSGPCEGDLDDMWEYNPSTGLWTWLNGSSTANSGAACTNQSPTSPGNMPSGRNGTSYWTDGSGKLWLLGGQSTNGFFNDLWNYDPLTGLWTWEGGASNTAGSQAGVYGTQGVPAAGNTLGARSGAAWWLDGSGNLWQFGGWGYGAGVGIAYLNDLWERTK